MTLTQIIIFIAVSLLVATVMKDRGRRWALLVLSLLAVFWLQPFSPIRHLDFWLACLTLAATTFTWLVIQTGNAANVENQKTAALLAGLVLLVALLRYLEPICCLTASPPPAFPSVIMALAAMGGVAWLVRRWFSSRRAALAASIAALLLTFIVLKNPAISEQLSAWLRALNGQPIKLASAADLRWLGFSYIAFRLLHVLRDRQTGKPMDLTLREFLTYVLFFPALTAGPIDRSQRFAQDLRQPFRLSEASLSTGGWRLLSGFFKKFVLADSLALIALNEVNAAQVNSSVWTWILTYAYALRIFFDFSGYTDIAIGVGSLVGIRLPENFAQPYLKPNLTAFWNSWHITLAQWFRAYFFNPFTRALRSARRPLPAPLIIFSGQLATMLLIGLWHGITWNFLIWGAWHGVGLFVHNRWSDFLKPRLDPSALPLWKKRLLDTAGALATFHYVTLGWVWFALPNPGASWQVFLRLFGYGN